ncbi:AAA family ATPase [Polyangium jinanense]|uniref:histidine kinase n=1 Tax=Polyangium jinanense TaxID=2829994 RepID=A0A9X3X4Q0_9BACT|nr:AAA family ATPase [Polyangium jinanense]MDC3955522.1 AAA family ATPase [Polyangium jinanense]MDC3982158.1 AAA family ATPase [Polyangium jinanense]
MTRLPTEPGAVHLKGYRVTAKTGESAGSATYRAYREADGVEVAMKMLHTDYTRLADITRFKHTYGIIKRIDSERVVKVHDVEEHGDGLMLITEYFPGTALSAKTPGKLDIRAFLDAAVSMAEALADIHRRGLTHGDVRPPNILLGEGGQVKLTGFGVDSIVTREKEEIYSPRVLSEVLPYTSPEQTGRMNRSVDYRTDMYSLGVVFYEMLAGRKPFEAMDPLELMHAHIAVKPIPPSEINPEVPDALSAITMKLLSKNAEDRYHSAEGLKADLEECRWQWEQSGRIGSFGPGQRDRRDIFQIHQKLYGREGDIRKLIESFDAVLQGKRAIVLVSGYSGIGKSSLVQEILKPLAREKGYYISGKYDQHNRDTPYSAIVQAFDSLIKQLLSESEDRITKWRDAIRNALGSNGQVICDVLPFLKHIIGEQPPVPALGPLEAQNRFNRYFQNFVSVFARHAHPLAMFIDDLQWVDSASLSLITTILANDEMESLFFCGAYRDNEVSPTHPFIVALDELQKSGLEVVNIVLEPLRLVHLIELIKDSLQTTDGAALANAVLKKTGGNPFFVKQFMRHLYETKVLVFDPHAGWGWDLPQIARLEYTDNVLSLMAETIRRLSQATQEVLRLASAIGNMFELDVLNTVSERPPEETYGSLDRALGEGLIVSADERYRFAHDKIQEAAYSLIPVGDRPAFHYRIAKLLLGKLDSDAGRNLFDIVNHMNSAGDLIQAPQERMQSAKLNLEAAGRAEESAAFTAALKYLEHGMAMLPEDAWTSDYELTFLYHTKKGMMESLCERHDDALATLAGCFDHAKGRRHRTEVRRLKMNVQILKNDLPAALEEGLAALQAFDIHLPPYPDDSMLAAEFDRTIAMIGDRPIASLVDLPALNDPEIAVLQDVLQEMFSPTYQLGTNNFGITVMRILQNTLEHGVSKNSIYAYVNFGTFLCARLDIDKGYEFGRAAVRLNEIHPDKKSESMLCNMWGAWVQHWKDTYENSKASLRKGIHSGIETGQYIWAFYNTCNAIQNSLLRGAHLRDIVEEAKLYLPLCKLDKFNTITWLVGAAAQVAEELGTPAEGERTHAGGWVDIDAVTEEARRINNQASLYFVKVFDVLAGIFQGAYEEVAEIWNSTDPKSLGMLTAWHVFPCYYFYGGLSFSRAAETAAPALREVYLARLGECARKVELWAQFGPASFRHRNLILQAELARVEGREGTGTLYDSGIAAAREGRFLHDAALASELCARHYLDRGREFLACAYMTEAHRLYARWGAFRVTERLERDFPQLLQREATRRQPARPSPERWGAALQAEPPDRRNPCQPCQQDRGAPEPPAWFDASCSEIDFATVLKASQAVSGELVLDRLLETLLSIAVEHAGAERGLLIHPRGAECDIEAEVVTVRDRVEVTLRQAPITPADLPTSILHYVIRTRETVILDDAAAPNLFSDDAYVRERRPRSVLCLALVKQGTLVGVLYLENNLTPRVFTADRITMLELLASQSAISLENARLYTQLQQENSERKRAEQALREREARIRRLVDSNIIGIAFWDLNGGITYANDAFLRFVGYSREDLVSGSLDWAKMTPPESHAATERALEEIRLTGQFKPFEKEFFRKDGSRVPVLLGGARFEGSESEGVAFFLDLTERKQAEERQKILLNELNHRVKNTLVIVQAIAGQTLRMAESPKAFTEAFVARLLALSQTHNLLNETSWQGASLRDIVCAELAPHANGDAGRFSLTGEEVHLRPEAAVTLGMVFHELSTNAAKYGALSLPSGHVKVTWNLTTCADERRIHLEWQEMHGPPVREPRRKGFGSRLIERDLGRQLASAVHLEFLPEGVRCVMDLPLERVAV